MSDPAVQPARSEVGARAMGRRGQRTRQRLLDSAAELLGSSTYREVRVVDIARNAQMSPAAFYQYFGDVEEAVLALAEEMVQVCGPDLASLIRDRSWDGAASAWSSAIGVADGFLEVWDRHGVVLRVVDLATDEGDQRFRALRTRFLGQPSEALVDVLCERRATAGSSAGLDARAEAGVAISMLAHVAAHHEGLEQWGAPAGDLRQAMARLLFVTVTGDLPPGGSQSSSSG